MNIIKAMTGGRIHQEHSTRKGVAMTRIGVIGATGYTGAELIRMLTGHPDVKITLLTSRQYSGVRFDEVYPSMAGFTDAVLEPYALESVCEKTDLVFTALPHKLPMEIIPGILKNGVKVIDLSADFRFKDAAIYEAYYQPHTAPDLLDKSVYGLCEVYADEIRKADLVGNPGCYPTCAMLPLIPLLKERMIDPGSIIADSKSGVSGAGRSLSLTTHFCEATESFKAYKVGSHRHAPEIEAILSRESGQSVGLTFIPHLIPMSRGMLTTSYAVLTKKATDRDILEILQNYYRKRFFIRILEENRMPDTQHVRCSNFCDIGCKIDPRSGRLILVSAIDNLVKGASGQAIQNMNLMLGLNETRGLDHPPYPV